MMSVAAARKALDRAGVEAGQIDTVIVSTVTHLYQTPAVATLAQQITSTFDVALCVLALARCPRSARSAGSPI